LEAGNSLYQEMIEGKRDHFQIEKRYLRKGGQVVYGRLTASVVRGPAGQAQYAIAMVEDITEKKMLEAQFLRAQRMENVGTLAGGVAHDLNNVLAPILMSCELLQMEARDEGTRNLVGMIKGSAQRGADLVRQVLSFARGVEGRRIAVQPKYLIREMVNIIRLTFPKSVSIQFSMSKSLWLLSGDPTQLHQVLLNLCVNARDAMPDEGILQITAENVALDAGSALATQGAKPGPYVVIKVIDTGTGILPEVRERIFDPFFTTKEPGKGTGLGLSTTLGIVRSHGGFIDVASELGKGSTFEVWLPADAGGHPSNAQDEETRLPRGNGEVILVVDDEVSLRLLTRDTLESFGYVVLTATNGADALGIYSRHKDNINAVLTDTMMPVMDGIALTRAITQINPDVRVILASGLSDTEYQNQAIIAGVKRFLPKPYKAELLLSCLAEILHDQ
jgi:signal transduction histidine kinase/CheY-like chemotaxis protein